MNIEEMKENYTFTDCIMMSDSRFKSGIKIRLLENLDEFNDEEKSLIEAVKNSKIGFISIRKIKSHDNPVNESEIHYGITSTFGKNISCYISGTNEWYVTSTIQDIDWDKNEFTTLNSVYSFDFDEINEESLNNIYEYYGSTNCE